MYVQLSIAQNKQVAPFMVVLATGVYTPVRSRFERSMVKVHLPSNQLQHWPLTTSLPNDVTEVKWQFFFTNVFNLIIG